MASCVESKEKQATNKNITIKEFKTTQRAKHYSLLQLNNHVKT